MVGGSYKILMIIEQFAYEILVAVKFSRNLHSEKGID